MRHPSARLFFAASLLAACSYYNPSLLDGQAAPVAEEPEQGDGGEGGEGGMGGAAVIVLAGHAGSSGAVNAGGVAQGGAGQGGADGGMAGSSGMAGDGGRSGQAGAAGQAGASGGAGGAAGSAGGSGTSGTSGTGGGCNHATYPNPPAVTNAGGTLDVVVAIKSVDFGDAEKPGEGPSYLKIGYDLDLKCSCQGEPHSCKPQKPDVSGVCDGVDGRDNSAGAFVFAIGKIAPGQFGSATWNNNTQEGSTTLILRIRNYNGLADDDRVDLAWYVPAKYTSFVKGISPKWDGTDEWPIHSDGLELKDGVGGSAGSGSSGGWGNNGGAAGSTDNIPDLNHDIDKPIYHDPNAYVSGGVVVGSLPVGGLNLGVVTLQITGAFITGKLVPPSGPDGVWRMTDGLLVGRWRATDILSQAPRLNDPFTDKPLCKDNPLFPIFKSNVCDYADISSGLSGPTIPCDSLSVGISFDAIQAKLGPVKLSGVDEPICPPATDPKDETCE